jgi:hypothetical protein
MQLRVNIPDISDQWQSQRDQYPEKGRPGITYSRLTAAGFGAAVSETLLYYAENGALAGVLNYFPNDIPAPPGSWVDAEQRGKTLHRTCRQLLLDCRPGTSAKRHRNTTAQRSGETLATQFRTAGLQDGRGVSGKELFVVVIQKGTGAKTSTPAAFCGVVRDHPALRSSL